MNTSELLDKYTNGDKLTNEEAKYLYEDLLSIEKVLIGKGQMFYATRFMVSLKLTDITNLCKARGII